MQLSHKNVPRQSILVVVLIVMLGSVGAGAWTLSGEPGDDPIFNGSCCGAAGGGGGAGCEYCRFPRAACEYRSEFDYCQFEYFPTCCRWDGVW